MVKAGPILYGIRSGGVAAEMGFPRELELAIAFCRWPRCEPQDPVGAKAAQVGRDLFQQVVDRYRVEGCSSASMRGGSA